MLNCQSGEHILLPKQLKLLSFEKDNIQIEGLASENFKTINFLIKYIIIETHFFASSILKKDFFNYIANK